MNSVPIDSTEVLILQCPHCSFLSLRVQALHEHLSKHPFRLNIKLYKCKTCGTVTNSEKVVEEHISIWHPSENASDSTAIIFDDVYNTDKPALMGSSDGSYVSSQYPGQVAVPSLIGSTGSNTQLPAINLMQLMNMASGPVEINLPGIYQLDKTKDGIYGKIRYIPNFLSKSVADELLEKLRNDLPWKQLSTKSKEGEERKEPRLTCYCGPKYEYSGLSMENSESFHPKLTEIKSLVETACGSTFNSVLGVMYRQGKDSMGWHSDNERELGQHPTIASVSLGQTRVFELMRKFREDKHIRIRLGHGDLLVTEGSIQELWRHRIPKDHQARRCRVNFTFRTVTPKDQLPPEPEKKPTSATSQSSAAADASKKSPGPVGSGKKSKV